jgi:hypothetical protein
VRRIVQRNCETARRIAIDDGRYSSAFVLPCDCLTVCNVGSVRTRLIRLCDLYGGNRFTEITNVIRDPPGIGIVVLAPETGVVSVVHSPLTSEADISQALEEARHEVRP